MNNLTSDILGITFLEGLEDSDSMFMRLEQICTALGFEFVFYSIGHQDRTCHPTTYGLKTVKTQGVIPKDLDITLPLWSTIAQTEPFIWNIPETLDKSLKILRATAPLTHFWGISFPFWNYGKHNGQICSGIHLGSTTIAQHKDIQQRLIAQINDLQHVCAMFDMRLRERCLDHFSPLTPKEIETLEDYSLHRNVHDIAEKHGKNSRTIQLCLQSARNKLSAADNAQAVDMARDLGYL